METYEGNDGKMMEHDGHEYGRMMENTPEKYEKMMGEIVVKCLHPSLTNIWILSSNVCRKLSSNLSNLGP